jgi:glyoxylate reductase
MSKKQKVLPKVCVACGADYNEAITSAIGSDILALLDSKVRTCTMDEAINSASGDDPVVGIIIAAHAHIDGEVLDRICIPGRGTLKVVSNYGVGVDHIDLESCRERGIPVCHTPNVLSDATADMGFLLLMAASRRLIEGDTFTRKKSGKTYTQYQNTIILGQQVAGSTVGIIGMGRIGLEVARRSIGFKMNVLYFNRRRRTDSEEELTAAGAKSVRYCSTGHIISCAKY